jgi:periplasmic divalent cation tolerance protein
MMKYAMVMTTTDKRRVADAIAKALVKKGLAACVQVVGPITSTFIWKKKIGTGKEWLLLIKGRSSSYKRIEKEITRLHNYELPEIIRLPINAGSRAYLNWIDKSAKAVR